MNTNDDEVTIGRAQNGLITLFLTQNVNEETKKTKNKRQKKTNVVSTHKKTCQKSDCLIYCCYFILFYFICNL